MAILATLEIFFFSYKVFFHAIFAQDKVKIVVRS